MFRANDISVGRDLLLAADGDITLESSQDLGTLNSQNKSSGASIGVATSLGSSTGISFSVSANQARGKANGDDAIQQNTQMYLYPYKRYWWKRFIFQFFLWTIAIVALVFFAFGLARPFLDWLFHDVWHWVTLEVWLRYTLGAGAIAIFPAGAFTMAEWLEHGGATTLRKWAVAVFGVATLLVVEFAGIQMIKHQIVPALLQWLA